MTVRLPGLAWLHLGQVQAGDLGAAQPGAEHGVHDGATRSGWAWRCVAAGPPPRWRPGRLVEGLQPVQRLLMAGRFVAGMAAGVARALLAGYAAPMAPARLPGKAIAVVMMGTYLGGLLGWRVTSGPMTAVG
ncbi:hypothetical protein AB0L05_17060 [Nonomuraea pusilla]|uniref:hypothetical protein n=1 Tax=Nonomuraea pusilla TaxID=46177 RepID=UPI00331BAE30